MILDIRVDIILDIRVDTAPAGRRRPAHHALRRPRPGPRGLGPRQQRGHGVQAEGVRHALGLAEHQPIRSQYCEGRCHVTNHSSPGAASARPPAPGRSPPAWPQSRPISPRTTSQLYNDTMQYNMWICGKLYFAHTFNSICLV